MAKLFQVGRNGSSGLNDDELYEWHPDLHPG